MTFPYLQTNPAELILAKTGHMNAAVVLLDSFLAHWTFLCDQLVYPLVVLIHDHVVPIAQISTLQRPVTSQAAMPAHFRLALANHSGFDDIVHVYCLSTGLVGANLNMDALLCVLQTKQTLEVRLHFWVIVPKNLHQMEVCSIIASFFLTEREQLIDIPVSMVEPNMIDPAVLTKSVPTCIIVEFYLSQANSTLSHKFSDLIVLLVLDNISSSLFLIEQIIKIVGIEVREIVEHQCPSIRQGTEHRLHGYLFPNLLKQLIKMIDGVWTIFRVNILNGETINFILILLLILVILLLLDIFIVVFLHFILL